jgi:four helix bundle protein
MIQSFRDLLVWQKGMDLVEQVYLATDRLPRTETYGLTSQTRRAAVSIPSNIAEGKAVGGRSLQHHLKIAMGSESELQTQVELARRLGMLEPAAAGELIERASEVGRMLAGLLRCLPDN